MKYSFSYNDTPPSFNETGNRGHWKTFYYKKKRWQAIFEILLMGTLPGKKKFKRVVATASLRFDVSRRRDEGNFRAILEKSLGDALVNGGWIEDDTAENFVFQHVFFEKEKGPKRTTVHLLVEEE